ncbi:4452_t:CDS:2 [Dentiscutata erythropus]|uniref:4452_t:CDS:1 n=1 Tax=Dentiscutata erythropus TaxID=1348616 RepID=A0A9N9AK49_9GLOM|nr:4452_t:CDS:2 [Dentiscutata erythropus]
MHGITASSSVSRNTHANKRNEARKFINEGRFLKALNIYEEIYRYSGSTKNCQENWTISRICSINKNYKDYRLRDEGCESNA